MVERPEDLNLPLAVIGRIISDSIPAGVNVSAEAKKAIAKAASVFILYTSATAAGISTKSNRKTMVANDVMEAITEIDFPQFKEPMEKALSKFREEQKKKKEQQAESKKNKPSEESPESSKTKTKKKSNSPKKNGEGGGDGDNVITLEDSDSDEGGPKEGEDENGGQEEDSD